MRLFLLLLSLSLVGCTDIVYPPSSPDSVSRNPTTPTTKNVKIEYRVSGNATSVRIRFSNNEDGLSQVVTTLPYTNTFSTESDSLFVSLDVTPISYSALTTFPFLSAQIFVDGKLFREATSNEFLLNTLAVSGTWRR